MLAQGLPGRYVATEQIERSDRRRHAPVIDLQIDINQPGCVLAQLHQRLCMALLILRQTQLQLRQGHDFEFDGLAPGDYTITVSRDGYADTTVDATVGMDQNKDMGSINVAMSPVAQTNWLPFIVAGLLSGLVGLFLVIVVVRKRRRKEQ